MLETVNNTAHMAIAVHEEHGIILLNFWYRDEDGNVRWFWADRKNQPNYQMAEWKDCRRLYEQIDRLEANGVLERYTAMGARMLVAIQQDRMALEQAKANLDRLAAKLEERKKQRGWVGKICSWLV